MGGELEAIDLDVRAFAQALSPAQCKCLMLLTEHWQRPSRATFTHGAAYSLHWQGRRNFVDVARVGPTRERQHDEFRLLPLGQELQRLVREQLA